MKKLIVIGILISSGTSFAKTFTIKKDHHGAKGIRAGMFTAKTMERRVRFDDTSMYETSVASNQGDINKLFGFSDCSTAHHKNSARFGWRWFNNALEIHAYTYAKKKREHKLLKKIEINTSYDMKIKINKKKYVFSIDGVELAEMNRGCKRGGLKYKLYPYFGGDEKAPHDIHIEIDK